MAKTAAKKNMNMKTGDPGGFTIIEVVLVLAIAGLIFLMVFIALPALQRSQRDTQRRDDMARLATAINNYQTNNNGKVPGAGTSPASDAGNMPTGDNDAVKLVTTYLNSVNAGNNNEFLDPDGWAYGVEIIDLGSGVGAVVKPVPFDHVVRVYTQAECKGENAEKTSNRRDYAIVYKMEGSGTYCKDSR